MWFKNLQLYRLPAPYDMDAARLEAALAPHKFQPCGSLDLESRGWVAPQDGGPLVHAVNGQLLFALCTEKKLLPASVINQVAKAKASEIEDLKGFRPGRKQMKEIKEQVADELLPRAFPVLRITRSWIDPVNGWLAIDSSSPGKADDVLKLLIKSMDKLPMESLRVKQSPSSAMTQWLDSDGSPAGFTVDQDAQLTASGESKATIRYSRQSIEPEDAQRHIASGKQCTSLAMTWADKISFVLTGSLTIKRIAPLDVIKEAASHAGDDVDRFDSDMTLMTGELARMLGDLVYALGGEMEK